jgi:hypothetical protein
MCTLELIHKFNDFIAFPDIDPDRRIIYGNPIGVDYKKFHFDGRLRFNELNYQSMEIQRGARRYLVAPKKRRDIASARHARGLLEQQKPSQNKTQRRKRSFPTVSRQRSRPSQKVQSSARHGVFLDSIEGLPKTSNTHALLAGGLFRATAAFLLGRAATEEAFFQAARLSRVSARRQNPSASR